MLDLANLRQYKENNRLEAKRAQGGLPHSIWETYSAFANTFGGYILLGVIENTDKSISSVPLPDPERLVADFWNGVNNRAVTNVNILSDQNVQIRESEGNRIVVIEVPRADRHDKPVYIGTDPFAGTYRRNGEGDYRCTREEVLAMLRDQADVTQDARVMEAMTLGKRWTGTPSAATGSGWTTCAPDTSGQNCPPRSSCTASARWRGMPRAACAPRPPVY